MKTLLLLISGAAMIVLMGSCSSNDDSTIFGPGTTLEQNSTSMLNFSVKNVALGEGTVYSEDIIVMSKRMEGDVTIRYLVESASSEYGVDYTITTPNPCCIRAGDTKATFSIETFVDDHTEDEETIFITLTGADNLHHGGDILLGESVVLRITIEDNN